MEIMPLGILKKGKLSAANIGDRAKARTTRARSRDVRVASGRHLRPNGVIRRQSLVRNDDIYRIRCGGTGCPGDGEGRPFHADIGQGQPA